MKKIISLFLCFVLCAGQGVFPSSLPVSYADEERQRLHSESLRIPERFGSIQDVFKGAGDRNVILIQDAHSVPEAQRSLCDLIRHLRLHAGVSTVALEGAAGEIDLTFFRAFPDPKNLRKVFENYLDSGELSGAVAAGILGEKETDFFGMEDRGLYEDGVSAFLRALGDERGLSVLSTSYRRELETLKARVFSEEALDVDRRFRDVFEKGNPADALRIFSKHVRPAGERFPHLAALLDLLDAESRDMREEIDRPIEQMAEKLRGQTGEGAALAVLNQKIQAWRTGGIGRGEFAAYLLEQTGEELAPGSKLRILAESGKMLKDLRGSVFFREFSDYCEEAFEIILSTQAEKRIHRLDRKLAVLEKLAKLELTVEEWEETQKQAQDARSKLLEERQRPEGNDPKIKERKSNIQNDNLKRIRECEQKIEESFAELPVRYPDFVRFYELAERRDEIFISKIKAFFQNHPSVTPFGFSIPRIASHGSRATSLIVVAGGFHAEALKTALRREKISYVCVLPRIEQTDGRASYLSHMRGEVSWKKYFRAENGRIDLCDAFARATVERLINRAEDLGLRTEKKKNNVDSTLSTHSSALIPQHSVLLKLWRDNLIRTMAGRGDTAGAGKYTRLIDRAASGLTNPEKRKQLKNEWSEKLEKFIGDLKALEARGNLKTENILKLLGQNATIAWTAVPAGTVPAWWNAGVFRAEMRTDSAGTADIRDSLVIEADEANERHLRRVIQRLHRRVDLGYSEESFKVDESHQLTLRIVSFQPKGLRRFFAKPAITVEGNQIIMPVTMGDYDLMDRDLGKLGPQLVRLLDSYRPRQSGRAEEIPAKAVSARPETEGPLSEAQEAAYQEFARLYRDLASSTQFTEEQLVLGAHREARPFEWNGVRVDLVTGAHGAPKTGEAVLESIRLILRNPDQWLVFLEGANRRENFSDQAPLIESKLLWKLTRDFNLPVIDPLPEKGDPEVVDRVEQQTGLTREEVMTAIFYDDLIFWFAMADRGRIAPGQVPGLVNYTRSRIHADPMRLVMEQAMRLQRSPEFQTAFAQRVQANREEVSKARNAIARERLLAYLAEHRERTHILTVVGQMHAPIFGKPVVMPRRSPPVAMRDIRTILQYLDQLGLLAQPLAHDRSGASTPGQAGVATGQMIVEQAGLAQAADVIDAQRRLDGAVQQLRSQRSISPQALMMIQTGSQTELSIVNGMNGREYRVAYRDTAEVARILDEILSGRSELRTERERFVRNQASPDEVSSSKILRGMILGQSELSAEWFERRLSLRERLNLAEDYLVAQGQKTIDSKFAIASIHFMDRYGIADVAPLITSQTSDTGDRYFALSTPEDFRNSFELLSRIDDFLRETPKIAAYIGALQHFRITLGVAHHAVLPDGRHIGAATFNPGASSKFMIVLSVYDSAGKPGVQRNFEKKDTLTGTPDRAFAALDRDLTHELAHVYFSHQKRDFAMPVDGIRLDRFLRQYGIRVTISDEALRRDPSWLQKLPYLIAQHIYQEKIKRLQARAGTQVVGGKIQFSTDEIRQEFLTLFSAVSAEEFLAEALSIFWLDAGYVRAKDPLLFDFFSALNDWSRLEMRTEEEGQGSEKKGVLFGEASMSEIEKALVASAEKIGIRVQTDSGGHLKGKHKALPGILYRGIRDLVGRHPSGYDREVFADLLRKNLGQINPAWPAEFLRCFEFPKRDLGEQKAGSGIMPTVVAGDPLPFPRSVGALLEGSTIAVMDPDFWKLQMLVKWLYPTPARVAILQLQPGQSLRIPSDQADGLRRLWQERKAHGMYHQGRRDLTSEEQEKYLRILRTEALVFEALPRIFLANAIISRNDYERLCEKINRWNAQPGGFREVYRKVATFEGFKIPEYALAHGEKLRTTLRHEGIHEALLRLPDADKRMMIRAYLEFLSSGGGGLLRNLHAGTAYQHEVEDDILFLAKDPAMAHSDQRILTRGVSPFGFWDEFWAQDTYPAYGGRAEYAALDQTVRNFEKQSALFGNAALLRNRLKDGSDRKADLRFEALQRYAADKAAGSTPKTARAPSQGRSEIRSHELEFVQEEISRFLHLNQPIVFSPGTLARFGDFEAYYEPGAESVPSGGALGLLRFVHPRQPQLSQDFLIKRPLSALEVENALDASRARLGPEVLYGSAEIIIEEMLPSGYDLASRGLLLTGREAVRLGTRLAEAFYRMVSGAGVLYRAPEKHRSPHNHIYILSVPSSDDFDVRFVGWSRSLRGSQVDREENQLEALEQFAFAVKTYLAKPRQNILAWKAFYRRLIDLEKEEKSRRRAFSYGNIEDGLIAKLYRRLVSENPWEEQKQSWKGFFDKVMTTELPGPVRVRYARNRRAKRSMRAVVLNRGRRALRLNIGYVGVPSGFAEIIISDLVRQGALGETLNVTWGNVAQSLRVFFGRKLGAGMSAALQARVEEEMSLSQRVKNAKELRGVIRQILSGQGVPKFKTRTENFIQWLRSCEMSRIEIETEALPGSSEIKREGAVIRVLMGVGEGRQLVKQYVIKKVDHPEGVRKAMIASEQETGPRVIFPRTRNDAILDEDLETGVIIREMLPRDRILRAIDPGTFRSLQTRGVLADSVAQKIYNMLDYKRLKKIFYPWERMTDENAFVLDEEHGYEFYLVDWDEATELKTGEGEISGELLRMLIALKKQFSKFGPEFWADFRNGLIHLARRNRVYAAEISRAFETLNRRMIAEISLEIRSLGSDSGKNSAFDRLMDLWREAGWDKQAVSDTMDMFSEILAEPADSARFSLPVRQKAGETLTSMLIFNGNWNFETGIQKLLDDVEPLAAGSGQREMTAGILEHVLRHNELARIEVWKDEKHPSLKEQLLGKLGLPQKYEPVGVPYEDEADYTRKIEEELKARLIAAGGEIRYFVKSAAEDGQEQWVDEHELKPGQAADLDHKVPVMHMRKKDAGKYPRDLYEFFPAMKNVVDIPGYTVGTHRSVFLDEKFAIKTAEGYSLHPFKTQFDFLCKEYALQRWTYGGAPFSTPYFILTGVNAGGYGDQNPILIEERGFSILNSLREAFANNELLKAKDILSNVAALLRFFYEVKEIPSQFDELVGSQGDVFVVDVLPHRFGGSERAREHILSYLTHAVTGYWEMSGRPMDDRQSEIAGMMTKWFNEAFEHPGRFAQYTRLMQTPDAQERFGMRTVLTPQTGVAEADKHSEVPRSEMRAVEWLMDRHEAADFMATIKLFLGNDREVRRALEGNLPRGQRLFIYDGMAINEPARVFSDRVKRVMNQYGLIDRIPEEPGYLMSLPRTVLDPALKPDRLLQHRQWSRLLSARNQYLRHQVGYLLVYKKGIWSEERFDEVSKTAYLIDEAGADTPRVRRADQLLNALADETVVREQLADGYEASVRDYLEMLIQPPASFYESEGGEALNILWRYALHYLRVVRTYRDYQAAPLNLTERIRFNEYLERVGFDAYYSGLGLSASQRGEIERAVDQVFDSGSLENRDWLEPSRFRRYFQQLSLRLMGMPFARGEMRSQANASDTGKNFEARRFEMRLADQGAREVLESLFGLSAVRAGSVDALLDAIPHAEGLALALRTAWERAGDELVGEGITRGDAVLKHSFQYRDEFLSQAGIRLDEFKTLADREFDAALKRLAQKIKNGEIERMAPVIYYEPEMGGPLTRFIDTVYEAFESRGAGTRERLRFSIVTAAGNKSSLFSLVKGIRRGAQNTVDHYAVEDTDAGWKRLAEILERRVAKSEKFSEHYGVFFMPKSFLGALSLRAFSGKRIVDDTEVPGKEIALTLLPDLAGYYGATKTAAISPETLRYALSDEYYTAVAFGPGGSLRILAKLIEMIAKGYERISSSA